MSERMSYSVEVMAKLLQITPRRVQQLANEGIIEKTDRGRYDLIKSVQGYIRYLNDQIPNKASSDGGTATARVDAEAERAKYMKHKAELTRMEEFEKKGLLVDAVAMRNEAYRIGRTVQQNILNIPPRLSQDLAIDTDPNSIHRKLEVELRRAMQDIADQCAAGTDPNCLPYEPGADCEHWILVIADQGDAA